MTRIWGSFAFSKRVVEGLAFNGSRSSPFRSSSGCRDGGFESNSYNNLRSCPMHAHSTCRPGHGIQRNRTHVDENIEVRAPEVKVRASQASAAPGLSKGQRAQYPLKGKVTVITGSASGLGHAMAKAALAAGSHLAMVDLDGTTA